MYLTLCLNPVIFTSIYKLGKRFYENYLGIFEMYKHCQCENILWGNLECTKYLNSCRTNISKLRCGMFIFSKEWCNSVKLDFTFPYEELFEFVMICIFWFIIKYLPHWLIDIGFQYSEYIYIHPFTLSNINSQIKYQIIAFMYFHFLLLEIYLYLPWEVVKWRVKT